VEKKINEREINDDAVQQLHLLLVRKGVRDDVDEDISLCATQVYEGVSKSFQIGSLE
jgi:hypothetical protein